MASTEGGWRKQSGTSEEKSSIRAASEAYPATFLRMAKHKADLLNGSISSSFKDQWLQTIWAIAWCDGIDQACAFTGQYQ